MLETQIARSEFNAKFNRLVDIAIANGFTVEVNVDTNEYGEVSFAVIRRHSGEVKNFLDIVHSAEIIYLSSIHMFHTKRSTMKVQRTAMGELPVKLPASRILSWFAVWSNKSISEVSAAVA
jgi:hypothetical protein